MQTRILALRLSSDAPIPVLTSHISVSTQWLAVRGLGGKTNEAIGLIGGVPGYVTHASILRDADMEDSGSQELCPPHTWVYDVPSHYRWLVDAPSRHL